MTVTSTSLRVRHGRLIVALRARGKKTRCSGLVVLVSETRRGGAGTTAFARAPYAIQAGSSGSTALSLGHAGQSALAKAHGGLRALLLVDALSPAEPQAKVAVRLVS
jgi:hypothetical protein